jgi:hypothetical protein
MARPPRPPIPRRQPRPSRPGKAPAPPAATAGYNRAVAAGDRLVGRDREVRLLQAGLEEALAGRGCVFLLVGEPGIGKTRLADDVARRAGAMSMAVLWGRCWEAGGAPAYWPWLEVLTHLARSAPPEVIAALGPGGALLASIVPELQGRIGQQGIGSPLPPPSGDERFQLWRAVATLVRAAASQHGLCVVLEDLHAADEASLHLFHFLAREARSMRLGLLGTYRDVEAQLQPGVGDLLLGVAREASLLPLPRLDAAATALLLAERVGAVDPEVQGRIFQSTQGNPLFVEEMSRMLAEEGPGGLDRGVVPLGVRAVIRQRLDRLAPEARPLLELGAVSGDELDAELLCAASGQSASEVRATLQSATRAGVLADRAGRRRFAHALVREVLYRDLDEERRQALHGQVMEALWRLRGEDPRAPLAELAHHALAGPPALLPRAAALAIQAARRSLELLAYEEAQAVLERTVAAVAAAGTPPALRAEVLLALAETRIRCGDTEGGKTLCRDVAQLARTEGDPVLAARAALAYGEVFTFAVVDPVLVDLLEEALSLLPAGDSPWRVRLLARLASALQPSPSMAEPVRTAREAIAAARRLGARRTLLDALHAGMAAMMDVVHPRERMPLNLEIEQLALAEGDQACLLRTQARLAIDHIGLGELEQADLRIQAFGDLARELRAPWFLWRAPLFRSMRAMMHGRFAESEAQAAEALRIGRETRDPQVERCSILHREGFLRASERHQELRAHDLLCRRERAPLYAGAAWQSVGSALVAARLEDRAEVERHLALILPEQQPPVDNLYAAFHFVEPVAFAGSAEVAQRLLALLEQSSEQDVVLGMTQLGWDGPVARLRALLEQRLGRWAEAFAHFQQAIGRLERLGARPYLARCRYEYARALLAAPEGDERDGATVAARVNALFADALAEARALEMTGLVQLIERRWQTPTDAATATATATIAATISSELAGPTTPEAAVFTLRAEGEVWAITHAGRTFRLKDSLGMRYLDRLCRAPDVEVHVLELAGGHAAKDGATDGTVDGAGALPDTGDAGELLDEEARLSYRRRAADLREELAEAESFGDGPRAARARQELEFLAAELSRAVGLGGRARRAAGAAERARSAVQRRIKNALGRIEEQDPALASYLGRAIRTGHFCVFRPPPARRD